MGCDIHIIAEVKIDGVWVENEMPVFPNPYHARYKERQLEAVGNGDDNFQVPDYAKEEFSAYPESCRNYDWFAILANVRNGRGFAGVKTGQGFAVIAEPRGLPNDASQVWLKTVDEWRSDMHSHSFLYPEDFKNFDFNQVTMKQGIIPIEEYQKLREKNEAPKEWCGGISGPSIITVDVHEADQLLSFGELSKDIRYHVRYEWPVVYREWFAYEITNIVEPLEKLKGLHQDARIVFGFDN